MSDSFLIYGANGYSGRLVAEQAKREGLSPILAGRDRTSVEAVGAALGLEARILALDDPAALREAIRDVAAVVHCAGPFSATSAPMRAACRDEKRHYVDITGEVAVFEAAHAEDALAREAGIVVCPGVGFDVIPTDCVAACLKSALPDAASLALGFDAGLDMSKGTATTLLEGLGQGGLVRKDGRLRSVPFGHGRRRIDFGRGEKSAMSIPWGDVATAYYSTGVPDIAVFSPAPAPLALALRLMDPLRPWLASPRLQAWAKSRIAGRFPGPDETARRSSGAHVWGEARSPSGARRVARLKTANVYDVTVHGALMAVRRLLTYDGPGGYRTPSQLMGERCVEALPGSSAISIEG